VAALDCVAYVVTDLSQAPANAIDNRQADTGRTREFAKHVLARHNNK
jgi:hypothetical protein